MGYAFFDVDTQLDFMCQHGKLYVKDSEIIKPNISKLTKYGYENKIKILGSCDRHFGTSEYKLAETELDINGGLFPVHCKDNTMGCEKIQESKITQYVNEDLYKGFLTYIESQSIYAEDTLKILSKTTDQVIFEKQSYNVFWDESNPGGNQNIDFCLKYLDIDTFFVYGVATEYCVLAVVLGLLKRKKKVWVIDDCIYHITEEGKQNAILEMMKAGALFIKTDSVINLINRDFNR